MIQKYVKILLVLMVLAAMCGVVNAAMGIVAETHETSGVSEPVCTAPCECISLTEAMHRWGTDGYDYCSKTVCGQSADAMTQYYCLHQAGSSASAPAQAPGAAAGVTQKSPVGIATVLAALGAALLAAAAVRRK
jgi:hypothetical protein